MSLKFELTHSSNRARRGKLYTAHGVVNTPIFMPVGTKATVKGITPDILEEIGFEIILGNTYHLMLTPGEDIVEQQGGLHKFANWKRGILTDSGGYQVMSLSSLRKINDEKVEFRSHIDGSKHALTPERSVDIQHKLDSNITMVLDECIPNEASKEYVLKSVERTTKWAQRSKNAFVDRNGYGIFGINQGGLFEDVRKQHALELRDMNFDGYAIGGLAIGETQKEMFEVIDKVEKYLPQNKPRYLMGVGRPSDILGAIELGVDMFDCVLPTRMARNAKAFTSIGEINIRNAKHKTSLAPLDKNCDCYTCKNYSLGYLHHLFRAKEMLAGILTTIHNLHFYHSFIKKSRKAIENDDFSEFKEDFLGNFQD